MYPKRVDLIEARNRNGLTNRDFAIALGEPPSTTGQRLTGYMLLSWKQEQIIRNIIREAEKRRCTPASE